MEITPNKALQNKSQFISVFFRDELKTENGVHVGIVVDAERHYEARTAIYVWAQTKRKHKPADLIKKIFRSLA
jgi:hypothetical protein